MKYQLGEASWRDVCRKLSCLTWEFLNQLKIKKNTYLNVSLEDLRDSTPLDTAN